MLQFAFSTEDGDFFNQAVTVDAIALFRSPLTRRMYTTMVLSTYTYFFTAATVGTLLGDIIPIIRNILAFLGGTMYIVVGAVYLITVDEVVGLNKRMNPDVKIYE